MKKLLISIIAFTSFAVASAQTEAGKLLVGADSSLGFTSVKVDGDDDAVNVFDISPQVGYFVIDNLVAGLALDYISESQGDARESQFVAGPFVRYYFLEGSIKPFLQAEFLFGNAKFEDGDDELKVNSTALGFSGGASFFLNDFIALDAALAYGILGSEVDIEGAEKVDSSAFGIAVGFSLFF